MVVDASSCAEGVIIALETVQAEGITVLDAVEFVASRVAPRLSVSAPVASVAVHPTCSSTALGSTDALVALARVVSDDVVVPVAWGCCAFAGDRGMLHPELTASATAPEAAEVATRDVRGVRLGEPDLRDRDVARDRPGVPPRPRGARGSHPLTAG